MGCPVRFPPKRGEINDMRMHWLSGLALLAVVGLAGCSRTEVAPPEAAEAEQEILRLGDTVEVSLADYLALPRAELADKVSDWTVTVAKLQASARESPETPVLLPRLQPPITLPVYRESHFSARAGFSLPPYFKEGTRDAALALHLARFGDHEAALKLADPADKDLLARIDTCRAGRNYPVEWTQLVSLLLHAAQFKMANGEAEGATELVVLHRQLRQVLDARAASGPLGAALLPFGRRALAQAVPAWREEPRNQKALADDIEAALNDWGPFPAPDPALRPGAPQAEVARLFQAPATGRTVAVQEPAAVRRVLDLLALPVPPEGVRDVVAFCDGQQHLTELLLVYRAKIGDSFPEPIHLAHHLVDHGFGGDNPANGPGTLQQTYTGAGLVYAVTRVTRGNAAGAFVRVSNTQATAAPPSFARDPRDFGLAHFDRSFEENRVVTAPEQAGSPATVSRPEALAEIARPLSLPTPARAVLTREPGHDLLAGFALRWNADVNPEAVARLALPLWAAFGPGRVEGAAEGGGQLSFTWEDGQTRVHLRVPYDIQAPDLAVEDTQKAERLAERDQAAHRFDEAERKARLEAGHPRRRVPRSFAALNGVDLGGLQLGQGRAEALEALPHGQAVRRVSLADGVSLLFVEGPQGPSPFHAQQLFVRFGPGDRVAELRVRYVEGLHAPSAQEPALLTTLEKGCGGKGEKLPAPWAGLWADLAPEKPAPALYRWRDDTTVLTCQRDAGGAEVVLRDRPTDRPEGVELPPLTFCSRGVDHCALGDTQAEVLRRRQTPTPASRPDGARVLGQPASSPYDMVLVWFEEGRVVRVVARHKAKPGADPAQLTVAMQQAWARDIDRLGFLRRQEGRVGQLFGAYYWHDDRTRVRLFAQDSEEGPRLLTEWREWPLPVKAVVAKK
jgi:hypothetical protein